MSNHTLLFHPKIVKQIQGLGVLDRKKVRKVLQLVAQEGIDSRTLQIKKLHGVDNVYRLRVGIIRIIVEVNRVQRVIFVRKLGHRREVYRNL